MTTVRLLALACAMSVAYGCGGDDLELCKGCSTPTPTPTTTSTATPTPTTPGGPPPPPPQM